MTSKELKLPDQDMYIAYLGMYADNNTAIWGQYERLVDFIYEQFPATKLRFDVIAAPLLHTMAHSIELALKENIRFFREYHEIETLKNFDTWKDLEKSHDLTKLGDEFHLDYFRLHNKLRLGEDQRLEFNKYEQPLKELLDILDRSSETFRYATKMDKNGGFVKMAIENQKTFDLVKIKSLYDETKTLFIGAPNSLGRYTDFIDYQRANPKYDAGKGYLLCQRLHYTAYFLEQHKKWLGENMTQIRPGLWFDPSTGENYEIQVMGQDIYIIAVDPGKVLRRKIPKPKKE